MKKQDDLKPGQALRKGRISVAGHAYFITKCTAAPVSRHLVRPEIAKILIDSLLWARDHGWWRILGFAVMPGHYHLAIGLHEIKSLSDAVAGVSKFVSARANALLRREAEFWEPGFYDHAIRDRHDLNTILDYIHNNPVAAGLVPAPEAWLYSTANLRYEREIDWDWMGTSMAASRESLHRFAPDKVPVRFR